MNTYSTKYVTIKYILIVCLFTIMAVYIFASAWLVKLMEHYLLTRDIHLIFEMEVLVYNAAGFDWPWNLLLLLYVKCFNLKNKVIVLQFNGEFNRGFFPLASTISYTPCITPFNRINFKIIMNFSFASHHASNYFVSENKMPLSLGVEFRTCYMYQHQMVGCAHVFISNQPLRLLSTQHQLLL
jgi:hypothetical protein